jgi:hypothetical protein
MIEFTLLVILALLGFIMYQHGQIKELKRQRDTYKEKAKPTRV